MYKLSWQTHIQDSLGAIQKWGHLHRIIQIDREGVSKFMDITGIFVFSPILQSLAQVLFWILFFFIKLSDHKSFINKEKY